MSLTHAQKTFVDAYHVNRDASEAEEASGIHLGPMAPSEMAYVYFLVCPRGQKILYVGKGRGKRIDPPSER